MVKEYVTKSIPIAPLKMIAMKNCQEIGNKINNLIIDARHEKATEIATNSGPFLFLQEKIGLECLGYDTDNYLVNFHCPRFGSGEGKAVIHDPIRGTDLYILADTINHNITYNMHGKENLMSPDDHFQDLKRVIAACSGHAHRVNVIMPFLYESRQCKSQKMESLDCSIALQELADMGVENIITFEVHDPRVQNAIPIQGFDNFTTAFQFIRELITVHPDLKMNHDNLMIVSPNETSISRCVYYANVLEANMGIFYKKSDLSTYVDFKKSVVTYEYLGNSVENKDVFIVDDIISSGENIIDIATELKRRKARKVFIAATYGLFSKGFDHFDQAYEAGIIDSIFTTNLTFVPEQLLEKPYYYNVDLSKYIALIIDTLNHDTSVNNILNPTIRIQELFQR